MGQRWRTSLTHIEPNRILVRGYPLDETMGRVSFGDTIHLLLTGDLPTPSISRLVDAMLVSFIDHGATPPSTLATRNAATTGASLRGAVAAGILGFGRHHGGDILACRQWLDAGRALMRAGEPLSGVVKVLADQFAGSGDPFPPGFGHRYHARDPRAARLLQMALELDLDGVHTQLLRAVAHELRTHTAFADRTLPVNIDGAIAAVSADAGLSPEVADALLLISRVPGLAAHALEEQQREAPMRAIDPAAHEYDGPQERRVPASRK
jgi:citrate synthase